MMTNNEKILWTLLTIVLIISGVIIFKQERNMESVLNKEKNAEIVLMQKYVGDWKLCKASFQDMHGYSYSINGEKLDDEMISKISLHKDGTAYIDVNSTVTKTKWDCDESGYNIEGLNLFKESNDKKMIFYLKGTNISFTFKIISEKPTCNKFDKKISEYNPFDSKYEKYENVYKKIYYSNEDKIIANAKSVSDNSNAMTQEEYEKMLAEEYESWMSAPDSPTDWKEDIEYTPDYEPPTGAWSIY